MKHRFTLLFFVISSSILAQPVIESESFIQVEDVFEYSQALVMDLEDSDIQLGGGAELVWDFSNLEPFGPTLNESYFPLDSTPSLFALFFGNPILAGDNFSTHALSINVLDFELPIPVQFENAYQFYRSDEEGYFITGNGAEVEGLPLISAYDTLDRVLKFPMNFQDEDTNSFYFFTEVPGIGAVGQSGVRINRADAWGSVTTPFGTYECLRVRAVLNVTDTLFLEFTQDGGTFVRPEQVNYTWISPELGGILAEATYIADTLTSFRYLTLESALSTTSEQRTDFTLFPNPATDEVTIATPAKGRKEVALSDLTGREVYRKVFHQKATVDLSLFPEGLYLVAVESGNSREVRRLVVDR